MEDLILLLNNLLDLQVQIKWRDPEKQKNLKVKNQIEYVRLYEVGEIMAGWQDCYGGSRSFFVWKISILHWTHVNMFWLESQLRVSHRSLVTANYISEYVKFRAGLFSIESVRLWPTLRELTFCLWLAVTLAQSEQDSSHLLSSMKISKKKEKPTRALCPKLFSGFPPRSCQQMVVSAVAHVAGWRPASLIWRILQVTQCCRNMFTSASKCLNKC